MSVKTLPVEENVRKKKLEKDFSTVKSLDNISTQKWGKNSLPVEGLKKMFQWFIFFIQFGQSSDHGMCTQCKSLTVL